MWKPRENEFVCAVRANEAKTEKKCNWINQLSDVTVWRQVERVALWQRQRQRRQIRVIFSYGDSVRQSLKTQKYNVNFMSSLWVSERTLSFECDYTRTIRIACTHISRFCKHIWFVVGFFFAVFVHSFKISLLLSLWSIPALTCPVNRNCGVYVYCTHFLTHSLACWLTGCRAII